MIEPSVGVNPVMPGWPGFVSAFPYGLLTQVTGPTSEPLDIRAAKRHLRIAEEASDDDDDILLLVRAARETVERITERALLTQRWTLYLDSFPWWRSPILVPKPPCQQVVSVAYYDTDAVLQTWSAANYYVVNPQGPTAQRAQIVPANGVSYPLLPSFALTQRRPTQVQVTFDAGWTARDQVPAPLLFAMRLLVGHFYANREAVADVKFEELPMGVQSLLNPYRVVAY